LPRKLPGRKKICEKLKRKITSYISAASSYLLLRRLLLPNNRHNRHVRRINNPIPTHIRMMVRMSVEEEKYWEKIIVLLSLLNSCVA